MPKLSPPMKRIFAPLLAIAGLLLGVPAQAAQLKALVIDGQNNHNWKGTTPHIVKALDSSGLFKTTVATAPAKGGDMAAFKPKFSDFDVIISNYNGEPWSAETKAALEAYMKNGGGFVCVHAADNSFPEWKEYNRMIGVGGWGGRTEKDGPYVRFIDGKVAKVTDPGRGGSHGQQHDFVVEIRDASHPITAGLPARWLHVKDELYDRLRGPAENLTVLATAFANPAKGGSGHQEPMLMTIDYGKGRSFHTTLGHSPESMKCVGFIVTLQRGAEWAATGKVTQKIPADFPTADKLSTRE